MYVKSATLISQNIIFERFVECCEVNVEGKWVKGQRSVCPSVCSESQTITIVIMSLLRGK